MYGYQWADKARNVNDDDFWGVGVGRHISEHWSLELNNLVAHDFNGNEAVPNDLKQDVYSLDALLVFARKSAVSPYITFGAGYLDNDYYIGSGRSGPLAQAGLGLMIDIAQNDAKPSCCSCVPK